MLPNLLIRKHLMALEDLLGKNGLNAILNLTGIEEWISSYPSENDAREVPHALFTNLQNSLEEIYGPRMGRNLSRRAARSAFGDSGAKLINIDLSDHATLPFTERAEQTLQAMARLIDPDHPPTVIVEAEQFCLRLETCPNCGERQSQSAVCDACAGWIEGMLSSFENSGEIEVIETRCLAAGDDFCEFTVRPQ